MVRILIVDDSLVERVLVEGLLAKNPDYQMELAENGHEALDHIAEGVPDLIITDLMMPGMDGLELLREIRRLQPDLPVILMTAHGDEATATAALEAGAASYVVQRGDTLGRIAQRRGVSVRRLAEANGLSLRSANYPGQRLVIPGG